jgi:ABC-type cobalamin transport system ATPase subunit
VTQFNKPYTMTLSYMPESLGFADESTLAIYQLVGAAWQRVPTSQLDAAQDRVEATLDHLSRFAVLGEIRQVFLPLLRR